MRKPIIFSGPMVRAILEGRKSQTRRVLSNNKPNSLFNGQWTDSYVLDSGNQSWREQEIRYAIGDRLWVREGWGEALMSDHGRCVAYRSDETYRCGDPVRAGDPIRWRPSIYMPRAASRLTLTVTDVRVQRLQEISEADAGAEGCNPSRWQFETPRDHFRTLWNSLNAQRGFGWDTNPWCCAITFEVIRKNIDEAA